MELLSLALAFAILLALYLHVVYRTSDLSKSISDYKGAVSDYISMLKHPKDSIVELLDELHNDVIKPLLSAGMHIGILICVLLTPIVMPVILVVRDIFHAHK